MKIPDLTGGSYRYKEGAKSESTFRELTVHDDLNDAKETFEASQALREAKARRLIVSAGDVALDRAIDVQDLDGVQELASEVPSVPESLAHTRIASAAAAAALNGSSARSQASVVASVSPRLQRTSSSNARASLPAELRPRPSRAILSAAGSRASSCRTGLTSPEKFWSLVDEFEEEPAEPEDDEDAEGHRKMAKKDRLLADGTLALSKAQSDWTPELHASKCKAPKTVQRVVLNVRKWGRSNGSYDSEQNQQLSVQLFNFADAVEDRQAFLEYCNSSFQSAVLESLTAKHRAAAASFPPPIMCNLVVKGCQALADAALTCPNAAKAIMASLSTQPESVMQVPEADEIGRAHV